MSPAVVRAFTWVPVAAGAVVGMEIWAGWLHRRIWHRALWAVHRTHHVAADDPAHGRTQPHFERNDGLAFVHAPLAAGLMVYGCLGEAGAAREVAFGVGLGMTVFAAAYLIVHDGLVHRRLPVERLERINALRAMVRAHRAHHAVPGGGPPFGFFLGAGELRRASKANRRQRGVREGGT